MAKSQQSKKTADKVPTAATSSQPRKLKKPVYKSFRLQKAIKPDQKLPSAFRLLRQAVGIMKADWKVFVGIALIYGVLNVALVQGVSAASNLGEAKKSLDQVFNGNFGSLASAGTLFIYLLGSAGSNVNPTAGAYQFILAIVTSLALIWAIRQLYSGVKVRVRDGFYQGMYPLVPFLLVLLVVALQCVPVLIGAYLYNLVVTNGIAVSVVEHVLWGVMLFLTAVLSLYMVCSSAFALYIVSLPDMTPKRALLSARQLVRYRRWTVVRKVVFLPVVLLVVAAVIIIPLILFATPVAPWVLVLVSMGLLPIIHSYLYTLYRALL